MINLLPPESKSQLRAARINAMLLKLLIILVIAGAFIGGAILYKNSNNSSSLNQQSIDEQFAEYNQQAQTIDSKVASAKTVLASQINYSEIILAMASALPDTVTLDSISISNENINNSSVVEFNATGSKSFIESSMESDPGFQSKYPNFFSGYKKTLIQKNKDDTTTIKFSLMINYPRGL